MTSETREPNADDNGAQEEIPARLRVMVIEDDPDTLSATLEMLELMGHWATGVKNAELAINRFFEGAFDVVLTDVGLPALSGFDLAEILTSRYTAPIVFATGQPEPAKLHPGTVWLRKPYTVEQLDTALRRALASR